VVIATKGLEVLATAVGAIGIITGSLWLMVAMVGLMGAQSAFFSPALNGSIPELFPEAYVTKANAVLRMVVTLGILLGVSLSGFVLDLQGGPLFGVSRGMAMVGVVCVAVALAGFLVSFFAHSRPAMDPLRPFPWTGPVDTVRELAEVWRDRQLGRILVADVFIWAVGVFQLLVINSLGKLQFQLSDSRTSLLVASQLIGLALGGLVSARFAKGVRWFAVLLPAGLAMGLLMLAIAAVPLLAPAVQLPALYALIGLTGAAGGLFLIPCESFLQIRPAPARKGAVWASANFASFSGMAAASGIHTTLAGLVPTLAYGALGAASLLFTAWLALEFRHKEWA
jgi:acyl-[acyl-carrier-protein]-phospholipid O-acyltransferase / long-chain-fatty-acid--[acyl-carrier-protein] ligase